MFVATRFTRRGTNRCAFSFAFMTSAILAAAYIVTMYFVSGFREGWASVMVLMLLSTGVILLCLGVVGVYLGKVFEQTKLRPLYLVRERLNLGEGEVAVASQPVAAALGGRRRPAEIS